MLELVLVHTILHMFTFLGGDFAQIELMSLLEARVGMMIVGISLPFPITRPGTKLSSMRWADVATYSTVWPRENSFSTHHPNPSDRLR